MPAIPIPRDLEIYDDSLIKPSYSGECIPPWLFSKSFKRGNQGKLNLMSAGASGEMSLNKWLNPKDFFPEGHLPIEISHHLSFFDKYSNPNVHYSRNDHNWNKYVRSPATTSSTSSTPPSRIGGQGYYYLLEHDHKSFSSWFPPPYRVLLLLSLGLIAFAFDLHLLNRLGMNPWPIKRFNSNDINHHQRLDSTPISQDRDADKSSSSSSSAITPSPSTSQPSPSSSIPSNPKKQSSNSDSEFGTHYDEIYFLGFLCLFWSLIGWFTFRFYVDSPSLKGDPFGRHAQTLQGISVLGAVAATVWPGDLLCRNARWAFGKALRRILSPSFLQKISFSDILLADILTSYAKVLGDVWLTLCFLLPRSEHHTWWSGKGSIAVPIITSLPYLIRLRQCLSEYNTSSPIVKIEDQGKGKGKERILRKSRRPLANALKYASAFPVIWLSAWQGVKEEKETGEEALALQFWLLSVFINSLFSFWWDVTNDWGLDLLRWHTWASTPSKVAQGVKSLHKRGAISVSLLKSNNHNDSQSHNDGRVSSKNWRHSSLNGRPIETIEEEERDLQLSSLDEVDPALTSSSSSNFNLNSNQTETSSRNNHTSPKKISSSTSIATSTSDLSTSSNPSSSSHLRNKSTFLLRSHSSGHSLAFSPTVYQVAVVLDLVLRFAWSLKLSSHLHHVVELEVGVFAFEALEILRRSAWVFLRVEWEYVKSKRKNHNHHHQNPLTSTLKDGGKVSDDVEEIELKGLA